jgi:hypothetical protein
VYIPKSMTSSIVGCIYNVPQSINEEDILEVLSNQNGDKQVIIC